MIQLQNVSADYSHFFIGDNMRRKIDIEKVIKRLKMLGITDHKMLSEYIDSQDNSETLNSFILLLNNVEKNIDNWKKKVRTLKFILYLRWRILD